MHASMDDNIDSVTSASENNIESESLRLLEWPELSKRVASYASTSLGRAALFGREYDSESQMLEVGMTRERSERLLEETREIYEIEERLGVSLNFSGIREVVEVVTRASKGVMMTGKELLQVAEFLQAARTLRRAIEGAIKLATKNSAEADTKDRFVAMKDLLKGFRTFPDVESKIYEKLDDYGEVKDSADPKLREIRTSLRDLLGDIRGTLNGLMSKRPDVVQDKAITTRYNRFVVPLKISRKGAFTGSIVHDVSASGNTAYVEPGAVRGKNDKLREYGAKERARINAILKQLSEEVVVPILEDLVALQRTLGLIDAATTRSRFSRSLGAVDVQFQSDMSVHVMDVRHPLLSLAARDKEEMELRNTKAKDRKVGSPSVWREKVVPLNFVVGKEVRCAIITGPNTGGKTVAIKTLGLVSLMARAGLFVPASASGGDASLECAKIPFFDKILVDIGDDQSLVQSLSTFSGHVERVKRILNVVTRSSLILLDEVGSGTDPVEGSALATALLKHLSTRAALTFATTHHGELKALKYDKKSGHVFENASVEFDEETLAPTFKLVWGIPGKSNALAIASRLGLTDSIISSAKEVLSGGSGSRVEIESIIDSLQRQAKDAEVELQEAEAARKEATKLQEEFRKRTEALKSQEELLHKGQEELIGKEVHNAKSAITAVIREMQRKGNTSKSAAEALKKMEKIEVKGLLHGRGGIPSDFANEAGVDPKKLVKGASVIVPRLGSKSVQVVGIESGRGEKKDVVVAMGTFRVRVKQDEILQVVQPIGTSSLSNIPGTKWARRINDNNREKAMDVPSRMDIRTAANTLDIRGARVDEGIAKLEVALSRAIAYGTLFVIHGHGTGMLRKGLRKWMEECDLIDKFQDAKPADGGTGATIVYLK